ncbi:MAG: Fe-S protein assembly co-chaperone HscB [Acidobacteria bacterium]|nr:Fe-S protein assembly co-chaperone HscB [Acidobacteriota bacterium]
MNPVPGDLEREFHRLSRLFHPDYYNLRSPEERKFSLERSSFLNGAYRTVRDPVMRARYRLKLEGFNVDEERGKTPPDLLMEVFEINEQLEELSQAENRRDLTQASQLRDKLLGQAVRMKERLRVLDSELAEVFKSWDASLDDGVMPELQRQQLVARMHELLSYRSYIRNLVEDIEEKDREWE